VGKSHEYRRGKGTSFTPQRRNEERDGKTAHKSARWNAYFRWSVVISDRKKRKERTKGSSQGQVLCLSDYFFLFLLIVDLVQNIVSNKVCFVVLFQMISPVVKTRTHNYFVKSNMSLLR